MFRPQSRPEPVRSGAFRGLLSAWGSMALVGMTFLCWVLYLAGCDGSSARPGQESGPRITYVYDQQLAHLLEIMEAEGKIPADQSTRKKYLGLSVPNAEWDREPYVLALATRSRVPTILLLDAPWVQRYGKAGWLVDLGAQHSDIDTTLKLMPASIRKAFSLPQKREARPADDTPGISSSLDVMAVPYFIKGNVLFYRKDLLKKYCGSEKPPETWEELTAQIRMVMDGQAADQSPDRLKYGLLFHLANISNDFYPILWGFGGEVFGQGRVLLSRNRDQAIQAAEFLRGLVWPASGAPRMSPGPDEFERFRQPESLRQAFFHGEALFMINWNTRLGDLRKLAQKAEESDGIQPGWIQSVDRQVGWAPIPKAAHHALRYVNIGSFGWGLNREALQEKDPLASSLGGPGEASRQRDQRALALDFLRLVSSFDLQYLAAVDSGQIPSRTDVISKLKQDGQAPDAVGMFEQIFAREDVELKPRPYLREINNIMDDILMKMLKGEITAEEAVDQATWRMFEVLNNRT